MKYKSTRSNSSELGFKQVVLSGLADDGGLYLPVSFPKIDQDILNKMKSMSYQEIAFHVMYPYVREDIPEADFKKIINASYKNFETTEITPLQKLKDGLYLQNLHDGPTLAFKDVALQFLGVLFDYFNQDMTILGATSGDTGSAAIEGCKGRKNIKIFILHPHNAVSEIQRKQMTTVDDKNVFNIAIKGSFDDCQDIVKTLFEDLDFKNKVHLTAINSINWARILAQIVYYFYACSRADEKQISFAVPSGNFGNVFAGWVAKQMGAPIDKLIVATNTNDILDRFFKSGTMQKNGVVKTHSPSMDIEVSSNFERLLFVALTQDNSKTKESILNLKTQGSFSVQDFGKNKIFGDFISGSVTNDETIKQIQKTFKDYDLTVDPHTATGLKVAEDLQKDKLVETPIVCLATAHPSKFSEVVEKALDQKIELPKRLEHVLNKNEKLAVLDKSSELVKKFILEN